MKKLIKITLLIVLTVLALSLLAGCSGSDSLEDYVKDHKDIFEEVSRLSSSSDFDVKVEENRLTCTYDISGLEDMTEEVALHETTKRTLEKALDEKEDNYIELCKTLSDETRIDGIEVVIVYTYGDTTIAERTFTAE